MATLRLFASVRETAGTGTDTVDAPTVGAVLDVAVERFGPDFARLLETSKVWVNGEPAGRDTPLEPTDEVAVLPPVSGG